MPKVVDINFPMLLEYCIRVWVLSMHLFNPDAFQRHVLTHVAYFICIPYILAHILFCLLLLFMLAFCQPILITEYWLIDWICAGKRFWFRQTSWFGKQRCYDAESAAGAGRTVAAWRRPWVGRRRGRQWWRAARQVRLAIKCTSQNRHICNFGLAL